MLNDGIYQTSVSLANATCEINVCGYGVQKLKAHYK